MGNKNDKNEKQYTLNEILKFKGNYEEFKSLNKRLNESFKYKLVYTDSEKSKILYKGQIKNEIYNGRGILYDEEYIFDGYFKDGEKNGYFRVCNNDSTKTLIYEGFYKKDEYNGKGTLYNNDGIIYEGYCVDGKYEGIGIEYFQKGEIKRKMVYKNGQPLNECYGVLYNENNNEIYKGLLKDFKPETGNNITIYNAKRYIIYIGDFKCFEYNGKGILYYQNSDKIYFNGIFDMNTYKSGALYDPEEKKIYEGEFSNNKPKECKNIKLYELNGYIKFIGDLSEGKYQGYGKLYRNNNLLYDGCFKDDLYDGKGLLFIDANRCEGDFQNGIIKNGKLYKGNYLYYEGEFLEGKFHGQGIKYYDNGYKKLEGIFTHSNQQEKFEGKYFSPENELLYDGSLINEAPLNNEKIERYNDYTYKMYLLEKRKR